MTSRRVLSLIGGLCLGSALAALPGVSHAAEELTLADRPIYTPLSGLERVLAQEALQKALESVASHQLYRWENHDSGISGFITPLRTFRIQTGHFCRQFMEAVAKDDNIASSVHTACRTDQGRWIVVKR